MMCLPEGGGSSDKKPDDCDKPLPLGCGGNAGCLNPFGKGSDTKRTGQCYKPSQYVNRDTCISDKHKGTWCPAPTLPLAPGGSGGGSSGKSCKDCMGKQECLVNGVCMELPYFDNPLTRKGLCEDGFTKDGKKYPKSTWCGVGCSDNKADPDLWKPSKRG